MLVITVTLGNEHISARFVIVLRSNGSQIPKSGLSQSLSDLRNKIWAIGACETLQSWFRNRKSKVKFQLANGERNVCGMAGSTIVTQIGKIGPWWAGQAQCRSNVKTHSARLLVHFPAPLHGQACHIRFGNQTWKCQRENHLQLKGG